MTQIKQRQIRTFRTPDNGEGEPVRVIRVEGDRAIVKFLTGYIGTGSVPLESLAWPPSTPPSPANTAITA